MSKNAYDNTVTLKVAKSIYPKAEDVKKEYHSLNEEERRWVNEWVLNYNKISGYVFTGIALLLEAIALVVWLQDIGADADDAFILVSLGCAFIVCLGLIFVPIRNRWLLKRIDFDNVQECIRLRWRKGFSIIWQWDSEKQVFYEVEYTRNLPKCYSTCIVYHPYGMKFYIPKMKNSSSDVKEK